MKVVGQFNKGFIMSAIPFHDASCVLKRIDLFMIDQHAADEKYRFETFMQSTRISSQPLARWITWTMSVWMVCSYRSRPKHLDLPAGDLFLICEHNELLRMNGFDVRVDENSRTAQLKALPVLNSKTFDLNGPFFCHLPVPSLNADA
jgi:DNA mismatch repair protein PMS2